MIYGRLWRQRLIGVKIRSHFRGLKLLELQEALTKQLFKCITLIRQSTILQQMVKFREEVNVHILYTNMLPT